MLPPFISRETPLRTEPLLDTPPPHGVTGHLPADPNRVGPSHPPLNFVDGNRYIVLRLLVEAKHCQVRWNTVMRARGSGDKKVMGKIFELLFDAGLSEEQARDPELPRCWQNKSSVGQGVGGGFSFHHPPPAWKVSLRSGTSTQ